MNYKQYLNEIEKAGGTYRILQHYWNEDARIDAMFVQVFRNNQPPTYIVLRQLRINGEPKGIDVYFQAETNKIADDMKRMGLG